MNSNDGESGHALYSDDGLALRERLLAFRARHLAAPLPDFPKPTPGRLGDVVQPLGVVARLMSPTHEGALLRVVNGLQAPRLTERPSTLEARILLAVESLGSKVRSERLLVTDITARVNEGRPERMQVREERVGPALSALGFQKERTGSGIATIYDEDEVAALKRDYGLAETQEEPQGILTRVGQLVRGQR